MGTDGAQTTRARGARPDGHPHLPARERMS